MTASSGGVVQVSKRYVEYLRVEQVGGLVLLGAAVLAMVVANSPAAGLYDDLRHTELGVLGIELDLAHWASEGLLAVFFFVAGLEVKRELVVGELSDLRSAALPVVGALGGMVGPALVYLAVAGGDPGSGRGWAIPTATDIAFALGVLALVGRHAPTGLRVFLLSLAVVDDLGAIALIALLFTDGVGLLPLVGAAALCAVYALAQRRRVRTPLLYVPLALGTWVLVHDSGIHATVAGVLLALLTRVRPDDGEEHAPAERLEHRLQPFSAGLVVPVFAFLSSGVAVSAGVLGEAARDRAALGVVAGLLLGKSLGILGASWIAVRLRVATLPAGLGWTDLGGVALLAGTGFTVSLLLTQLTFEEDRADRVVLAVLVASVVAGVLGALAVRSRQGAHAEQDEPAG